MVSGICWLRAVGAVVLLAGALTTSDASAASPCAPSPKPTEPNPESAARWEQAARALRAPLFTEKWSRRTEQAFGERFSKWRARRLALLSGTVSEWLGTIGVAEFRARAHCFATLAERERPFRVAASEVSELAWEVLDPIARLKGPELDVATWARVARALTDLIVEERRAERSYAAVLPSTETSFYYGYLSSLGPYNELEESLARRALNACIEQFTLLKTWTQDSEDCEQLRGRVFRSEPAALDELRAPPNYLAVRFRWAPVRLRPAL